MSASLGARFPGRVRLVPIKKESVAFLARVALLAALYTVLARFGLQIHAVNEFATLVWPPTGVALAAILVLGYRFWPGIFIGAVLANMLTGAPASVALGIAAGNSLEALLGAYALNRIPGFRPSLDRLQDVLGLIVLAAVLSSMVAASIGVSCLLLKGIITPDRFALTWRAWWLGDAIGDLIVAPLLLTWKRGADDAARSPRLGEAAMLAALLVLASSFIFEHARAAIASLLSPLLVWAAIRFEQRGAARAMFLVSVIAIWGTLRGHGPFARETVQESLFVLQSFVAVNAATFLLLGAITSERRHSKELAEAANRAKDQFLAALSHELRTPLTPVLAISSSLEMSPDLSERTRRQIESVRRNAELEVRLIDDLLDLTRITRGKLQIEPEPVDLSGALDHVLEICREEAKAKGIVLEREDARPGTLVRADPARLRQIFWNLVKNAIKFTPVGGRILLRTFEPESGHVVIEISDTGVGLEPSELSRIFRPFEQVGNRTGGLGLGLAISSALVEAHGGTLTVASSGRGRGSTFRIELPVFSGAEPALRRADVRSPAGEAVGNRRVLLVEDHADTLRAAQELLEELSCQVFAARSVHEAIAAAREKPFDLVLSDIGLPDGSGLELMRHLHDRHGLSGIALSGYGTEGDLRRSRDAGFVDHLVKPITLQQLATSIEHFFADRRGAGPST